MQHGGDRAQADGARDSDAHREGALGPLGDLGHPAQSGLPRRACYGKTGTGPRQRVTRPLRKPGKFPRRQVGGLERPREEWIEIPVPALVSEEQFEQAQEQLAANKRHATRRTKEPTLLQGMLVCRRCGYAYYRCSTRTSKRKLYYYRCLGSDGWRYEEGVRCASRPVRQEPAGRGRLAGAGAAAGRSGVARG